MKSAKLRKCSWHKCQMLLGMKLRSRWQNILNVLSKSFTKMSFGWQKNIFSNYLSKIPKYMPQMSNNAEKETASPPHIICKQIVSNIWHTCQMIQEWNWGCSSLLETICHKRFCKHFIKKFQFLFFTCDCDVLSMKT